MVSYILIGIIVSEYSLTKGRNVDIILLVGILHKKLMHKACLMTMEVSCIMGNM